MLDKAMEMAKKLWEKYKDAKMKEAQKIVSIQRTLNRDYYNEHLRKLDTYYR